MLKKGGQWDAHTIRAPIFGCSSGQNARYQVRPKEVGQYLRVVDGLRFPCCRYHHITSYHSAVRKIRSGHRSVWIPRGTVSGRSRTRTWITCTTEWCSFFRTTEISTVCAQSQSTCPTPTRLFLDDSACLQLIHSRLPDVLAADEMVYISLWNAAVSVHAEGLRLGQPQSLAKCRRGVSGGLALADTDLGR